jgi:hypothetical protein
MRFAVMIVVCGIVAACASAAPPRSDPESPGASPGRPAALDSDGPYQLDFTLVDQTFSAAEPIVGTARLSVQEGRDTTISAPGAGPIAFGFTEVGGSRHGGPAYRMSCVVFPLHADDPILSPLTKSGGWDAEDSDAAFYQSFFADQAFHLPPGTWDLTAHAEFADDADCGGGAKHDLNATIRVDVAP